MPATPRPVFRSMEREEAEELLATSYVGRVAFSFHDRVDIEPIGYVYEDGWIYCRTSPGTKVTTLEHHPWVAFEVDEVTGPFDWRSVVVHGTFYRLEESGVPTERARYERALALFRASLPATLTARDPVPFRSIVCGIHCDSIVGRAATGGGQSGTP